MKSAGLKVFLGAVIGLICVCSFAQEKTEKATLAILPFVIDDSIRIDIGDFTLRPEIAEVEFTNQLTEFLVKSRKFDVLERDKVRKIIDENKLTESDWAKPGEAERIGKLLVADYLVLGSMNRLEFLAREVDIKLTGEHKWDITATLKIQYKVVETKSGKIRYASQVIEKLRSKDVREEVPVSERKDWTLSDYKDMLFTRTATKAGWGILEGIFPVKIASLNGEEATLNRGEGTGLSKGDILEVFSVGKAVVDPDTGETLGTEETKAGEIEITSVQPKFSKAKIVMKSDTEIKAGCICRRKEKAGEKEEDPAYPRANPGW